MGHEGREGIDSWLVTAGGCYVFFDWMVGGSGDVVVDGGMEGEFFLYFLIVLVSKFADFEFFSAVVVYQAIDNVGYLILFTG
mgnify:FL=1